MNKRFMRIADTLSKMDTEHITFKEIVELIYPFHWVWFATLVIATGVRRGTFEQNSDGTYKFIG